MKPQQFDRRKLLRGAGVVGAGAFAALAPGVIQAAQSNDTRGIEGAWLILVTPQGAPPSATYEVLNLYIAGGGVAVASAHAPATGSSVYGAWRKSRVRQFQITFIGFTFDRTSWAWTGRLKVQARATLSQHGRQSAGLLA